MTAPTQSNEVKHIFVSLPPRAALTLCTVSLELGGNAPLIVFEDADLHRAVDGIMAA